MYIDVSPSRVLDAKHAIDRYRGSGGGWEEGEGKSALRRSNREYGKLSYNEIHRGGRAGAKGDAERGREGDHFLTRRDARVATS